MNEQEAALVVRKVAQLLEMGVRPGQVAVISPYAAQVRLLREMNGRCGEVILFDAI